MIVTPSSLELNMNMHDIPRVGLAHLPTPLERMSRLAEDLGGPELWVKRDDLTGLAFGGNKTRKLELLVADAIHARCRLLLTRGAPQSNHCRQTAAAAARLGLECTLVLTGYPPADKLGNLLLDHVLAARIIWSGDEDPDKVLQEAFETAVEEARHPYLIPYGGSNVLGATAYALAIEELAAAGQEFDRIVVATSSGGTQAGMLAGVAALGLPTRVTGISVDPTREALEARMLPLLEEILTWLELSPGQTPEIEIIDRYLGGGYAVVGAAEREAIEFFGRVEGILVDPVYTGRAAAGLIDLIRSGRIEPDERVLFWHTGGTPALFAFPSSEILA
jgi:D-cysteine desulfhydrase family pyridoxal phosphate-dependent enzyme